MFLEAGQLSAGSQCVFSKGEIAGLTEGKEREGEFSSSLGQSQLYTCPNTCHQTRVTCPGFLLKVPLAPVGGCFSNSQGPCVNNNLKLLGYSISRQGLSVFLMTPLHIVGDHSRDEANSPMLHVL